MDRNEALSFLLVKRPRVFSELAQLGVFDQPATKDPAQFKAFFEDTLAPVFSKLGVPLKQPNYNTLAAGVAAGFISPMEAMRLAIQMYATQMNIHSSVLAEERAKREEQWAKELHELTMKQEKFKYEESLRESERKKEAHTVAMYKNIGDAIQDAINTRIQLLDSELQSFGLSTDLIRQLSNPETVTLLKDQLVNLTKMVGDPAKLNRIFEIIKLKNMYSAAKTYAQHEAYRDWLSGNDVFKDIDMYVSVGMGKLLADMGKNSSIKAIESKFKGISETSWNHTYNILKKKFQTEGLSEDRAEALAKFQLLAFKMNMPPLIGDISYDFDTITKGISAIEEHNAALLARATAILKQDPEYEKLKQIDESIPWEEANIIGPPIPSMQKAFEKDQVLQALIQKEPKTTVSHFDTDTAHPETGLLHAFNFFVGKWANILDKLKTTKSAKIVQEAQSLANATKGVSSPSEQKNNVLSTEDNRTQTEPSIETITLADLLK